MVFNHFRDLKFNTTDLNLQPLPSPSTSTVVQLYAHVCANMWPRIFGRLFFQSKTIVKHICLASNEWTPPLYSLIGVFIFSILIANGT